MTALYGEGLTSPAAREASRQRIPHQTRLYLPKPFRERIIDRYARGGAARMAEQISIVVAEDCLLVRDSVARALSTAPDTTVVGVAEDYDSAAELVAWHFNMIRRMKAAH